MRASLRFLSLVASVSFVVGCKSSDGGGGANAGGGAGNASSSGGNTAMNNGGSPPAIVPTGPTSDPPAAACKAAASGGSTTVQPLTLLFTLVDRYEEAWLGSPAVVDVDGDGVREIIVPRDDRLIVWSGADGSLKSRGDSLGGRIWASPVVADLDGDGTIEIAVASRANIHLFDAQFHEKPNFPVEWHDEIRGIGAGDLDGDGKLELIVSLANGDNAPDIVDAFHADGSAIVGFPPHGSGTSGCDDKCYLAGCYDQNVAVGDLDGDGKADIVAPHDNAYASFVSGSGVVFDANPMFPVKKVEGVRYLHDLMLAEQGYADDEETALQAHFTNTAPAIADLDGDGKPEVVMLASVQNASQDNRLQGVAVWALHPDASRLAGWETPLQEGDYLAGLWDFDGTNVVAATNQLSIADIDPSSKGPEIVFAGFDGKIHAVSADHKDLWATTYTNDDHVLTGGVAIGDLSGDGRPEIVFASYSTDNGKGQLFVLDAGGGVLQAIALPMRGAMPVPTLADVNGDGTVEIVVSLKDGEDEVESVLVYTAPGSAENCLAWPTGRGNWLRDGYAR